MPDGFTLPEIPEVPVVPRDAATVMLVRDTDGSSLEVFLQRRVKGMPFAGGMTVFPGGGVDARDADAAVTWTGPPAEQWAEWFECDTALARALVCAAVRETFEESGVLLAGPSEESVVADTTPFHDARQDLITRQLSLAAFLDAEGLVLRADLLRPWASWVTPPQEPRRYDTRFFLAALPAGQIADGATTEAAASGWSRPADALAEVAAGGSMMMPPTRVTLAELADFGSVATVLAAERSIPRVEPTIVRDDDGARIEFMASSDGVAPREMEER
ncbi:MAG: NUDIX hydrolase [Actinophytocola sp.]|nr:NUDIX hydrolase [Actinophytocola sp.]